MKYLIDYLSDFYNPSEIHVRIPSPPIVVPCFYGINMSTIDELLAPKYIENINDIQPSELNEISNFI